MQDGWQARVESDLESWHSCQILIKRSRLKSLHRTPGVVFSSAFAGETFWFGVGELLQFGSIPAMRLFLLLAIAAVLVGCRTQSKRTADQFAFMEVGMPLTVVTN